VRAHDIAETRQALAVAHAIRKARTRPAVGEVAHA
jgi:dihydropteroate synthase